MYGYINLWDVETKEEIWRKHNFQYPISNISFSPDGKLLVFVSRERINLLDIETKQLTNKKIEGSFNVLTNISFSPNGKILALDGQKSIILLDVKTQRSIATLRKKRSLYLSFSSDGKTLASSGYGGYELWSLDLDFLINLSCNRVNHYLQHNPQGKKDKHLCDGIATQK